jgi:hypothetical protein
VFNSSHLDTGDMNEIGLLLSASMERAPWGWGLFALVLLALIKGWPALSDAATRAREAMAKGRQVNMAALSARVATLEAKVEEATHLAHTAEMKLVHAVAAVQLLAAKIRADNPSDPTLKQAMELLAAATTGSLSGWAAKLADGADRMKGQGE